MVQVSLFGADPVNTFAVRVWLGFWLVQRFLAGSVQLVDMLAFLLGFFLGQLTQPAHLLVDLLLGLVGISVFIQQLHVLVRAGIALFHELLVVMLVPLLLRVLLTALLLLDGLGELPHEIRHARRRLFGALGVLLRRESPFGCGDREHIIRALDHHPPICLAEPLEIEAVGHVLRRLLFPTVHGEGVLQRDIKDPHFA